MRHRAAQLFGRGDPDPTIERRVDATRGQLAGTPQADLAQLQADLARQWRIRFADLLADHPEADTELVGLAEALKPLIAAAAGHSVAAGRDVMVSAERGSVAAAVIHGDVTLPGPPRPGPVGR